MSSGHLAVRSDGDVLELTLDRPEKRNALSLDLREKLADALTAAAQNHGAVVLAGAGSAFCSGMDTTEFGGDRAHRERIVTASRAAVRALAQCPLPVVAAVQGPALAGGFVLALLADIRIAGPAASFGFPEVARGIPAGYAAARAVLAPGVARDLALTGRIVGAQDALALGVVSEIAADPLARARSLARDLASQPRGAARATKVRILADHAGTLVPLLEREEQDLVLALLGPD